MAGLSGLSGCAALAKMNASGISEEALSARNKALDAAIVGLSPCGPKGQPTDTGLVAVHANADGQIVVDGIQWQGSEVGRQCILDEAAKLRLPPWNGPVVADVWGIGTKDHPPPTVIAQLPQGLQSKLATYMARADDVEHGPVTACAQRNIPNEAYAVASYRVFIFSDGKIAAVTPWEVEAEGRDVGFLDCTREWIATDWSFEPFAPSGFTMTQVNIQRGVDAADK